MRGWHARVSITNIVLTIEAGRSEGGRGVREFGNKEVQTRVGVVEKCS